MFQELASMHYILQTTSDTLRGSQQNVMKAHYAGTPIFLFHSCVGKCHQKLSYLNVWPVSLLKGQSWALASLLAVISL